MTKIQVKSLNPLNFPLEKQREIAKVGMGVSLALTASTALLMKNPTASKLHTLSGVALVGFSLWHYSLYPKAHASKTGASETKVSKMSVSGASTSKVSANLSKVSASNADTSVARKTRVSRASGRKARTNKTPSKA